MKKTFILQLTLCAALCVLFACKEKKAESDTTSTMPAPKEEIVKKIQKAVLSPEELAKLTRFQDKATGKYGYKNEKGDIITKPIYDAAMSYRESGLVRVAKDGKFGYIGLDGTVKIPVKFDDAGIFSQGLAAIKEGKKWGYINETGQVIVPPVYDFTLKFSEGMSSVQQNGKWGYIDKSGTVAIPIQYEATGYFNNGLASVRKDGKWGYINAKNTAIIPFEYDRADPFGMSLENAGRVTKAGATFYIDASNMCVKGCK